MAHRKLHAFVLVGGLLFVLGAAPVHADDLSPIAKKLVKASKSLNIKRIAVLLFPYADGNVSSGTSLVSERLAKLLAQTSGLQVVEKSQLLLALRQMSGDVAGKDLELDAIVTGTLQEVDHHRTVVNARLIQPSSGVILAEASAKIKQTWYDPPQFPPEPATPNAPYVMHASPLIYTPQGFAMGNELTTPGSSDNEENVASNSLVPAPVPAVVNAPEIVVIGEDRHRKPEEHRHDDERKDRNEHPTPKNPHEAAVRSEFYYAAGLTLEQQGHSSEAAHLYASAVKESPAPSPLQSQAEKHSKKDVSGTY